jgi:hypothetical protein
MGTVRFLATAVGLFFAVFFGMKWMLTVHPLKPDSRLPTFHSVDTASPEYKIQQSSVSDGDPTRDRLRNDVIDYAKALADDPCNKILMANYIKAVVAYTRAWISIVPCIGTQTCHSSDSALLDRAAQAFGSPLDHRVRDAMQHTHAKTIFGTGAFPKDTVHLVATLAADSSINSAQETKEFRRVTAQLGDTDTRQDCGR